MIFQKTLEQFDVVSFLEYHEIPYKTQGKNISTNWIGTACPFCDDDSTHFGIDLRTKACSCWRCGGHKLTDFLQTQASLTYGEVLDALQDYALEENSCERSTTEGLNRSKFSLPSYFTPLYQNGFKDQNPALYLEWVKKFFEGRELPPKETCQKWKLYWGGSLGPYKFRIVIPIFLDGEMVSFTSRDVTSLAEPKYKSCPNEKSQPIKSTLYNLDSIKKGGNIIVCEGPGDVWKMGPGSVATFGTSWSQNQVDLLKEKKLKKAFILFDNETQAQKSADKLAEALWFIPTIEVLCLKEVKDPGELSIQEAQELMKSLV